MVDQVQVAACSVEGHDRERLAIIIILRILEAFDCDLDLLFFALLDDKWLGEASGLREHHLACRIVNARRLLQNRLEVVILRVYLDLERLLVWISSDFCWVADYDSAVSFKTVLEAEGNRADGIEAGTALGS